jgi:hypothetical protein
MEEAPKNSKESSHSAHANGMNEQYMYAKTVLKHLQAQCQCCLMSCMLFWGSLRNNGKTTVVPKREEITG